MFWSFDLIGNGLVWNVGNGTEVCIGADPWVDCKWRHLLPSHLIESLHYHGFYFLKEIGCPGMSMLLEQGRLSSENIDSGYTRCFDLEWLHIYS